MVIECSQIAVWTEELSVQCAKVCTVQHCKGCLLKVSKILKLVVASSLFSLASLLNAEGGFDEEEGEGGCKNV